MISNRRARKQMGEAVRLVRQKRGMTQTELAGALGLRPSEVGRIEDGEVGFNTDLQKRLEAQLEVPVKVLVVIGLSTDPGKLEGFPKLVVERVAAAALEAIGGAA